MGWVVNATPRPLYPCERLSTHCRGGRVGPRTVLDGCGKPCLHRGSIPGPSGPWRVGIPTDLSRPVILILILIIIIIIIINAVLILKKTFCSWKWRAARHKMKCGPPQNDVRPATKWSAARHKMTCGPPQNEVRPATKWRAARHKMTCGPPQILISEPADLRFEFEQYLYNCSNKSFHGRSHHTL